MAMTLTLPAFAKTHREIYKVPCNALWPAIKDTLRNSGKYGIIGIDSTEMTASYNIGGFLTGKRINSLVLNPLDDGKGCEMQIQTSYSGLVNNDEADFKKRVDESLAKLKGSAPSSPTDPVVPTPSADKPPTSPSKD